MFWSYLWGIETAWSRRSLRCSNIVLIVPMRNWNSCQSCKFPLSFGFRFDRTYEELKRVCGGGGRCCYVQFWSYLWGIETRAPEPGARMVRAGFDRTYEELKLGLGASHRWIPSIRFDRTYEELKLPHRLHRSIPRQRFDRTYEELKLASYGIQAIEDFGFDRTYEELKLNTCKRGLVRNKSVLIVPMRNWNLSRIRRRREPAQFWSYLWGIETRHALDL